MPRKRANTGGAPDAKATQKRPKLSEVSQSVHGASDAPDGQTATQAVAIKTRSSRSFASSLFHSLINESDRRKKGENKGVTEETEGQTPADGNLTYADEEGVEGVEGNCGRKMGKALQGCRKFAC